MVSSKRIEELADRMKIVLQGQEIHWGTHGRLDEAADLRPSLKNGKSSFNPVLRAEKMAEDASTDEEVMTLYKNQIKTN